MNGMINPRAYQSTVTKSPLREAQEGWAGFPMFAG